MLPTLHIETLRVDGLGTDWRNAANEADMRMALPVMAANLACLSTLIVDGSVTSRVDSDLGKIFATSSRLSHLCLRGCDGHFESVAVYDDTQGGYQRLEAGRWSSTFQWLRTLKSLRSLRVGRLEFREAFFLSKAIPAMPLLKILEVCASVWSNEEDDGMARIVRSEQDHSPLLSLLWNSTSRSVVNDIGWNGNPPGHTFPTTLQRLILTDRYHCQTVGLFHLLQEALKPCLELDSITITLLSRTQLLNEVGTLPSPEHPVRESPLCLPGGNWKMSDNLSFEDHADNVLTSNGLQLSGESKIEWTTKKSASARLSLQARLRWHLGVDHWISTR